MQNFACKKIVLCYLIHDGFVFCTLIINSIFNILSSRSRSLSRSRRKGRRYKKIHRDGYYSDREVRVSISVTYSVNVHCVCDCNIFLYKKPLVTF